MTSSQQSPKQEPTSSGLGKFWAELRCRKVMRVAVTYAVVAWLIMQVAGLTFEGFGVPIWAFRFVVIVLWLFFPVAIILTWAFELTPEGIKTTKNARESQGDESVSKTHLRKRNWMAIGFAAALPTVVFGALALFFFVQNRSLVFDSEPTLDAPAFEVKEKEKSVAVLPLENMSPDPDNAFFADGVHEDILTNLSKVNELLVIGRTSTQQYRNTTKTLQQIGSELGVRYLVEGSVRRVGNQVRITVQLTDSEAGGHLWAENYNRQLDDIFAIQADIAKVIASELKAVISPTEIALIERKPTENLEAYEYYVKHRDLDGGYKKIALLEKAVEADPEFAEAWAALVTETIFWWDVGTNRSDTNLRERAHYALAQAERTGPELPHLQIAKHTIALRNDRDLEKAVEYLLGALAIDPAFYLAHTRLGQRYYQLGRLAEAQHHLEMALKTDPYFNVTNFLLEAVFRSREMWNEVREFSLSKIGRGHDGHKLIWSWRLITNQYLETGDKQALLTAIRSNDTFKEVSKVQLAQFLLQRDLREALRLTERLQPADRFSFFNLEGERFDFDIEPRELLAALIHFEQADQEKAVIAAKKAHQYNKEIIDENPMAFPFYWSSLTVCYALMGEADLIPSTVEELREKTDTSYWKYDYEVHCELHIAIAYLVVGDHEKAIETLEAASKMDGPIFLNRELDLWFIFDRLRGNPRFDALLEN